jgi:hypothetical protein
MADAGDLKSIGNVEGAALPQEASRLFPSPILSGGRESWAEAADNGDKIETAHAGAPTQRPS